MKSDDGCFSKVLRSKACEGNIFQKSVEDEKCGRGKIMRGELSAEDRGEEDSHQFLKFPKKSKSARGDLSSAASEQDWVKAVKK